MDWDDDELTYCGDNMRLKRYDNYETYYGQTKGWDQRHGFDEYKESDDCMEGICYKGRWRNDNLVKIWKQIIIWMIMFIVAKLMELKVCYMENTWMDTQTK